MEPALATTLCLVHRCVRRFEQSGGVISIGREAGRSGADPEREAHLSLGAIGHFLLSPVEEVSSSARRGVGPHHGKLFAAVAGEHVRLAGTRA